MSSHGPLNDNHTLCHQLASPHLMGSWCPFDSSEAPSSATPHSLSFQVVPCFRTFLFPLQVFWFFMASSSSFNSIQCHFFREVFPIILSEICLHPSPSIYFAVIFPGTTGFTLFTILIMNSTYFIGWYPFIYLFTCSFYFCSLSSIKSGISIVDNHFICNAKQELWHIIGPQ